MPQRAQNLVRMADFAALCGVPAATIKHYVREGLLPEPHRTGATVAWYDPSWAPRVRTIKQLQRRFFLPLSVIKDLLANLDDGAQLEQVAIAAAIARSLAPERNAASRTRTQLLAAGMSAAVLDGFIAMGVVTPVEHEGEQHFDGDDLALLRTLDEAREVGLSPDMLPMSILSDYMRAIAELVHVELDLFRRGVLPRVHQGLDEGESLEQLAGLTEHATRLSERLVVLLRRQLLQPTLQQLFRELAVEAASSAHSHDHP